jgi:glycerate kinase
VRAPLLGPAGAAAVFGPQKGATPAQVAILEAGLARLAAVLGGDPGRQVPDPRAPGSGAAGGTGYGLAVWGADLLPGSAEVARIAGLGQALAGAALVITGEGQYDATSGTGKVVGAVCAAARAAGVPAAVVAGRVISAEAPGVIRFAELAALAGGSGPAMAEPSRWLREAGRLLAGELGGSLEPG